MTKTVSRYATLSSTFIIKQALIIVIMMTANGLAPAASVCKVTMIILYTKYFRDKNHIAESVAVTRKNVYLCGKIQSQVIYD